MSSRSVSMMYSVTVAYRVSELVPGIVASLQVSPARQREDFGVDDPPRAASGQDVGNVLGGKDFEIVHRLLGVERDVGAGDQVRPREQRMIGRRSLRDEDIERGASDPSVVQRSDQGVLIDDAAAGGVDDERGRLHRTQQSIVDQASRLLG